MDQAPRSAFLSLIVLPEERTAVMGVVNILKTLAQSSGPSVTGILAGRNHFWVAFVVAGSLKAAYDLMLLAFFGGRVRPREDGSGEDSNDAASESASDIAEDTEQGVIVSSEPVDSSTGRRHH
jgi:para-aminobenzoate synthetase